MLGNVLLLSSPGKFGVWWCTWFGVYVRGVRYERVLGYRQGYSRVNIIVCCRALFEIFVGIMRKYFSLIPV